MKTTTPLTGECRILPLTTMSEIAALCARLSRPDLEVHARIEAVNGKPVAYLVRTPIRETCALLRRQAGS